MKSVECRRLHNFSNKQQGAGAGSPIIILNDAMAEASIPCSFYPYWLNMLVNRIVRHWLNYEPSLMMYPICVDVGQWRLPSPRKPPELRVHSNGVVGFRFTSVQ